MPDIKRIAPVTPDVCLLPTMLLIDGEPAWRADEIAEALDHQNRMRIGWDARALRAGYVESDRIIRGDVILLRRSGVDQAVARTRGGAGRKRRLLTHVEQQLAAHRAEIATTAAPPPCVDTLAEAMGRVVDLAMTIRRGDIPEASRRACLNEMKTIVSKATLAPTQVVLL